MLRRSTLLLALLLALAGCGGPSVTADQIYQQLGASLCVRQLRDS